MKSSINAFLRNLSLISLVVCFMVSFAVLGVMWDAPPQHTVYLVSPENGSFTNQNNDTLQFIYNHTGTLGGTVNCTLYLGGVPVNHSTNILADTNTVVYSNQTIPAGQHWWWVNCTNGTNSESSLDVGFNYTFTSDYTNPTINFTSPTPDNNSYIPTNYTEINLSITEPNLDVFKFNWNGTDYMFYNDSLVLAMNFNNNSGVGEYYNNSAGMFIRDISGHGNNGTTNSTPQSPTYNATGRFGGAFEFDGAGDYISIPNSSSLKPQLPVSFSFWIKPRDVDSYQCIVATDDTGPNYRGVWARILDSGKTVIVSYGDGGPVSSTNRRTKFGTTVLSNGVWYHVAVVVRGATDMDIYINGVNDGGTYNGTGGPIQYSGNPSTIGFCDNGGFFNGTLDEVRIYCRSLSADEILVQYQSELQRYNSTEWRFYTNITNLTDGTYTYYGWANDSAGNTNQSEIRTLTVDTTPPALNFTPPTPDNAETINVNHTYINVSVTDASDTSAFIDWNRSLAGYWNFEYVLGNGTVYDNSTWGNHGTMINFTSNTSVTGKYGRALLFDGVDDCVRMNNSPSLSPSDKISLEAWIKPVEDEMLGIIEKQNESNDAYGFNYLIGRKLGFQINWAFPSSITCPSANGSIELNKWSHVVATYDSQLASDNMKIYINGVLNVSCNNTNLIEPLPNGYIDIGVNAGGGDEYFNGTIDEVRIWSRALSPGEINASYNNGAWRLYRNFTDLADGTYEYYGGAIDSAGNFNVGETRTLTVNSTADITPPSLNFTPPTPDNAEIVNVNHTYINVSVTDASNTSAFIDWNRSLVGYWGFNENSGNTVVDYSTYGNNGVLKPAPSAEKWVSGQVDNALHFDGLDDYVDCGNDTSLSITGAITVEAWVKWAGTGNPYFVTKLGDENHRSYDLSGNLDGTVEFRFGGASCNSMISSGSIAIPADEWVHLVGTYEPSSYVRLFVNGSLVRENTTSIPASQCDNMLPWNLGAREGEQGWFNGSLDEVRIYNRSLNATEINRSYQRGLSGLPSNISDNALLGYWALNETLGDTARDSSSGINNGTLYNYAGPIRTTGKFGKALLFDGAEDHVPMAENDNFGGSNLTVSAWIKIRQVNAVNPMAIVTRQKNSNAKNFETTVETDGRLGFYVHETCGDASPILKSPGVLSTDRWYHVCFTIECGVERFIFVDGVLVANSTNATTIATGCGNIATCIGGRQRTNPPWFFNGSIDEVMIFDRVLSPEEINASYNNGAWRLYRNFTGLADGTYEYYVGAIDLAGNFNKSEVRSLTVDAMPPIVSILLPVDGSSLNSTTITVNGSTTDPTLNYTNISLYNSSGQLLNSTLNYSSTWSTVFVVQSDGNYTINATAYDNFSRSNTASVTVIVDTVKPSVIIHSPVNETTTADNTPLLNASSSDNNSDSMWYSLDSGPDKSPGCSSTSCLINNLTNNAWHYSNWNYRMNLTLTNNNETENLTDYQVLIILNTTNFNYSKANVEGNDTRFTWYNSTSGTETEISYWIREWNNTGNSTIWVRIPSLKANSTAEIYMYYGNPSAGSESNGDATFKFFDDFEDQTVGGTPSGWSTPAADATFEIVSDVVYEGNRTAKLVATNSSNGRVYKTCDTINSDVVLEFHMRQAVNDRLFGLLPCDGDTLLFYFEMRENGQFGWYDTTWHNIEAYSANTWYKITFKNWDFVGYDVDLYIDDAFKANVNFRNNQNSFNTLKLISWDQSPTPGGYADGFIIRKYTSSEPSFSVGGEEVSSNFPLADGIHSVTLYACDTAGNLNSTMHSFTVDTTPPTLNFTPPTQPNNTTQSENYAYINVSVTDSSQTSSFIDWNRSLVGYWNFEYVLSNGTVYGNSTYQNHGLMHNFTANTTVTGKYGKALLFDGADDYVQIADDSRLDIANSNCTVEGWAYSYQLTGDTQVVFQKYGSNTNNIYGLGVGSLGRGFFYLRDTDGNGEIARYSVDLIGAWHHLVGVREGNYMRIYVDGILRNTTDISTLGLINTSNHDARIGMNAHYDNDDQFNGIIDEVRVWNRALSPGEINASYNNGAWRLYRNFTGLADGTYEYYAGAIDLAGNFNVSETRNLTINTTPNNPPNTPQLNSPGNGTYINRNYILLNWTCTDPDGDTMTAYVYGDNTSAFTLINTTTCLNGSSCTFNWTGLNETTYLWKINCSDPQGLSNVSDVWQFTVDTTAPALNFIPPTPPDNTTLSENHTYINVSVTDSSQTSSFIDWNRSLVGYWSFEHVLSNGTVYDNSTWGNDGSMINFTVNTSVTGKFGRALLFDGVDDTVSVDYHDSLNTSPNMAVEAWFYVNSYDDDVIVSKRHDGGYWLAAWNSNCTQCLAASYSTNGSDNQLYSANNSIETNKWYYGVLNVNGTVFELYLDGRKVANATGSNTIDIGNTVFCIGEEASATGCDQGYNFNGTIDEVRVWSRALSPEEINASYNTGLSRLYRNFTNLADGTYEYYAYSIDLAGNMNKTETRNLTVGAVPPLYLSNCTTLNTPGATYYLNQSVSSNGTCMQVQANNITLDCQGYTINYSQSSLGYAINNSNQDFTTIKNCNIVQGGNSSYAHAIYFYPSSNNTLTNNNISVSGQDSYGVYIRSSDNNTLTNNKISTLGYRGHAVYMFSSSDNNLINNSISASVYLGHAVYIYSSLNNKLTNNNITTSSNVEYGICLHSSSNADITGNTLNTTNSYAIYIYGSSTAHYTHVINNNTEQGKPIYYYLNNNSVTIENLGDIGELIIVNSSNMTLRNLTLDNDAILFGFTGDSIIEDCNISTPDGISLYSSNNTNLTNNKIHIPVYRGRGIYIRSSNDNNLINNNITTLGNGGVGIQLSSSSNNNNLINNDIATSGEFGADGIQLSSSSSNNLTNNTITTLDYLGRGIRLYSSSDSNNLVNNNITTSGQSGYGIYLCDSDNNNITSCLINASYLNTGDLFLHGADNIKVLNSNYTDIYYNDTSSDLWRYWYLDVYVNDTGGSPVDQANVTCWDVTSGQQFTELTNSSGYVTRKTLLEYNQSGSVGYNSSAKFGYETFYTNYTLNATKTGYSEDSRQVNLTGSMVVYLTLTAANNTPYTPQLNSPGNGTYINRNYTLLNWTCTDPDGDTMTAYVYGDNTSASTLINTTTCANGSSCTFNWTNLNETTYLWKVNCTDPGGLSNVSNVWQFTVDTIAPAINFTPPTPPDNTTLSEDYAYINVSVIDSSQTSSFIDWNRSLVGYWSFEHVLSDGTVYDNSTWGNDGAMINFTANTTVAGKFGKALLFDGVDDHVTIPDSPEISGGAGKNFTFSFWLKTNNIPSNESGIINKFYNSASKDWGFLRRNSSGNNYTVDFYLENGEGFHFTLQSNPVSVGAWHYIALLWNGSTRHAKMYVNGVLVNNGTSLYDMPDTNAPIRMGKWGYYGSPHFFNGSIDEVRIWSRILTPEEISASYNTGLYRLYRNFTNLPDGTYEYYAYSIDLAGNMNKTETRNLTINATLNNPPYTPQLNSPGNATYVTRNYALLNWTCIDPDGGTMTAYVYGDNTSASTLINTTTCANGSSCTFNWTGLNETIYLWKVNCTDLQGLSNISGVYHFTVDWTPPNITILYPPNNTNLSAGTNWTWINISTDENAVCRYNLSNSSFDFATQGINFTNTGGLMHSFNYSGLSDGQTYTLHYKCNDSAGNINPVSVMHVFGVNASGNPPAITDFYNNVSGDNSTNVTINETQIIYFNVTVDQQVDYSWYRNGTQVGLNQNSWTWATNSTDSGIYNITVVVNNSNGTDSVHWDLTINDLVPDNPPSVQLNNPLDYFNTSMSSITFNCTAWDDVNLTNVTLYHNCGQLWDVNGTNTTPLNGTPVLFTRNLTECLNALWNCYACDTSAQCSFAPQNRTFTIDLTPPSSNNPADASHNQGTSASINWILADNYAPGYYYVVRNGTIQNTSTSWINGTNLNVWVNTSTVGVWNYTIYYNDSVGHMGTPDTIFINISVGVDNPPTVQLNSPQDGVIVSSAIMVFNCTASDDLNLSNVTLYGSWGGWHANETNSSGVNGDYMFTKNLTDGVYTWNCYACDSISQCSFAGSNTFTANVTGTPDLYLSSPDIGFSDPAPSDGQSITITTTVHNLGGGLSGNFTVEFLLDGVSQDNEILSVDPYSADTTSFSWTAAEGTHTVLIAVDPQDNITELNESNNNASRQITVSSPPSPPSSEDMFIYTDGNCVNQSVTITVLDRDNDPVSGVAVRVYFEGHRIEDLSTNSQGETSFVPQDVGDYELRAHRSGYRDVDEDLNIIFCASCSDGIMNQDESDVDCGGSCPPCGDGGNCSVDEDCVSGWCYNGTCRTSTCSDGIWGPGEGGVDCGGPCPPCASCNDSVLNQDETDIDCGGSCPPCADGGNCSVDEDCISGWCYNGTCRTPTCYDGILNLNETDVDCGGGCPPCVDGGGCVVDEDCVSGYCYNGTCMTPSCFDGIQNLNETGVDCGGSCIPCHCFSGVVDGDETGVDCGGACPPCQCSDGACGDNESDVDCGGECPPCENGRSCLENSDCISGWCYEGTCRTSTCSDGIEGPGESGVDCGGPCLPCHCFDGVMNSGEEGVDCGRECPPCVTVWVVVNETLVPYNVTSICLNNRLDGGESDVDCGGHCTPCDVGRSCLNDSDCLDGWCYMGTCRVSSCMDGICGPGEKKIDCGGSCGDCPWIKVEEDVYIGGNLTITLINPRTGLILKVVDPAGDSVIYNITHTGLSTYRLLHYNPKLVGSYQLELVDYDEARVDVRNKPMMFFFEDFDEVVAGAKSLLIPLILMVSCLYWFFFIRRTRVVADAAGIGKLIDEDLLEGVREVYTIPKVAQEFKAFGNIKAIELSDAEVDEAEDLSGKYEITLEEASILVLCGKLRAKTLLTSLDLIEKVGAEFQKTKLKSKGYR